jgi:hypothetical protein
LALAEEIQLSIPCLSSVNSRGRHLSVDLICTNITSARFDGWKAIGNSFACTGNDLCGQTLTNTLSFNRELQTQASIPLRTRTRKMSNRNPKSHRWSRCSKMLGLYGTMEAISSLGWKTYVKTLLPFARIYTNSIYSSAIHGLSSKVYSSIIRTNLFQLL